MKTIKVCEDAPKKRLWEETWWLKSEEFQVDVENLDVVLHSIINTPRWGKQDSERMGQNICR